MQNEKPPHQTKKGGENTGSIQFIHRRRTGIEFAEVRLGLLEKSPRLSILDNLTCIQDDDAVIIKDRIELMRHGNDGVAAEFLANNALHDLVRFGINAMETISHLLQGMGGYIVGRTEQIRS